VLSKLGEQQCKQLHLQLAQNEPLTKDIGLVVVSPMRRTLQTAMIGLESVIESGVKVVTDAKWQGKEL
jgi:broad specificity phosphatase PhoE